MEREEKIEGFADVVAAAAADDDENCDDGNDSDCDCGYAAKCDMESESGADEESDSMSWRVRWFFACRISLSAITIGFGLNFCLKTFHSGNIKKSTRASLRARDNAWASGIGENNHEHVRKMYFVNSMSSS